MNEHAEGLEPRGKIFELRKATDPDTLAILDARRRCLAEPKTRLNTSMKALFCEVLDRALNPTIRGFICKGVVAISDPTLARIFSVSDRSIYTWKYGVAAVGYFWLSKKATTNMEPITVYNITCLRPQGNRHDQNEDGASQSGPLRHGWSHTGTGARKPKLSILPPSGSPEGTADSKNEDLQAISGESRKNVRLTAEENCGSDPKETSGESRKILRVTPEENCGSEPKKIAAESRSGLPVPAEENFQHKETQKEGKESKPVPKAGTRLGTPTRAVAAAGEKDRRRAAHGLAALAAKALEEKPPEPLSRPEFLALCESTFGTAEMQRNGGLWTLRWREDARCAVAALMDTRTRKTEGVVPLKPGKTWAGFCTDLYQRLRAVKEPACV